MAADGATSAFAGEPQPVEVFHRGRWYAGDLLGWRHDEQGICSARVRVVVDRLRHSAWVALGDLRLPVPAEQEPPTAAPRTPSVRPELPDDTQPHLLLPRPARPPVPPPVAAAPAAVPPPGTRGPVRAPGSAADDVPTTRALPLPDAVPVG